MRIINFFKKKTAESSPLMNQAVSDENTSEKVMNESMNDSNVKKENGELITIIWGTGMPIDVIFNYIHKDREEEGYSDALVSLEPNYREKKEEMIRNELKLLFKRISIRYKDSIRVLDVQIENAITSFASTSARMLEVKKKTCEEHLNEMNEMESLLEKNDSKMTNMIESYRRGFLKGIAAKTNQFNENII